MLSASGVPRWALGAVHPRCNECREFTNNNGMTKTQSIYYYHHTSTIQVMSVNKILLPAGADCSHCTPTLVALPPALSVFISLNFPQRPSEGYPAVEKTKVQKHETTCLREHSKKEGKDLNSSPSDSDAVFITAHEWTFAEKGIEGDVLVSRWADREECY